MPSARFLCSGLSLLTMLPTGRGCSSRTWSLGVFLHLALGMPGSMAGQWLLFCPLASKIGLALCQLLFRNRFPPALWVLVLLWFHFKLRGIKLLAYSHKASEWQAWDSDPDGERNNTRGPNAWDRVGAAEEERRWKGKESKGLTCHPFQVCLGPLLSCGHSQKQYSRNCSRIGTSERKIDSQRSPTGTLFYSRAKAMTQ